MDTVGTLYRYASSYSSLPPRAAFHLRPAILRTVPKASPLHAKGLGL